MFDKILFGTIASGRPLAPEESVGLLLIGRTADLRVFRADSFAEITLPTVPINPYVARLSGNVLATTRGDATSDRLEIYDWPSMSPVSHGITVNALAPTLEISPDTSKIVVGYNSAPYYRLFDTTTYSLITLPISPPSVVNGAAWSNDGSLLALTWGNFFTVFDTTTWAVVAGPTSVFSTAWCVSFSPDDAILAVGHGLFGQREKRFSTSTWTALTGGGTLAGQGFSVDWSPSGDVVTYGSNNSPNGWQNCDPTTGVKTSFATSIAVTLGRNMVSYRPDGAFLMCKGYLVDGSTYEQSNITTPWSQVDSAINTVYFTKGDVIVP